MYRRDALKTAVATVALPGVASTTTDGRERVSDPYRPLGSVAVENAKEAVVGPDDETAFVAATSGFATVDLRKPDDLAVLATERRLLSDRESGPLPQIWDVDVDGDRLAVVGPAHGLDEANPAAVLYDVSDPANPERVAVHDTEFAIHNCFLRDGVLYLTRNDGPPNALVLVDVRDDAPEAVGQWSLRDENSDWGTVTPSAWQTHDVWVRDDYAYVAHWDAGTVILDVSDPTDPEQVARVGGLTPGEDEYASFGSTALPGNAHYAMATDDGSVLTVGKEAWATESADGPGGPGDVELWDVSDATNPRRLSTVEPPPTDDATREGTWTTSHNFDVVGDRLFTSWYQGGVKIHDISDPANPEEMAWWRDPDSAAFFTAKLATQEFFVASTLDGRVFTFPNRRGRQEDPPSLTPTTEPSTTAATGDATRTTTANDATVRPSTSNATERSDEQSAAEGEVSGFGVVATVAALGVGAWARLRDEGSR